MLGHPAFRCLEFRLVILSCHRVASPGVLGMRDYKRTPRSVKMATLCRPSDNSPAL